MTKALTEARGLVEGRLAELDEEREQLKRAPVALGGPRGRTPALASIKRRGQGAAAAFAHARKQHEGALLEYAKANPDASNREIAKALKVSPAYVSQMLSRLKKAETLERRGGRLVVGITTADLRELRMSGRVAARAPRRHCGERAE